MWHKKLQELLQNNLEETKKKNRSFSLRSMAQRLEMNPGTLSEIMRGNRKVSAKKAQTILKSLPNPNEQIAKELSLLLESFAEERILLPQEAEEVVAKWQSFAILALFSCENYPSQVAGIAKRLGLDEESARISLEKLLSYGLVEKDEQGNYSASGISWQTTDGIPSKAIRASHLDGMRIAEKALEKLPVEKRDFGSMTFAADRATYEKATRELRDFRERLKKLMRGRKTNSVYRFNMQLFPLDQWEE